MTQGWTIDATADQITFFDAPTAGTNNIVVKEYGGGAFGGATSIWALGAWSDYYGYPTEVEYYGDRMYFAGSVSQPQTIWASRVSAYSDFGKSPPVSGTQHTFSTTPSVSCQCQPITSCSRTYVRPSNRPSERTIHTTEFGHC